MARGNTFIKFRNWDEVCVEYDIDCSGPGSGCAVEWWFKDMTAADHDRLQITSEEEEAISRACIDHLDRYEREPHDGDVGILPTEFRRQPGTPISEISGRPGHPGFAEFCRIARSWGYD
jgi:hypothetical protein